MNDIPILNSAKGKQMSEWNKEADRALSERSRQTRMLWPAAQGTFNEGRNQFKREKRAQAKADRAYFVKTAPGAPKQKVAT